MKKNKLYALVLITIISVTSLTGCFKNNDSKIKKIGISQLVEHPSLDESRKGFIKALEDNGFIDGKNIKIEYQNAQNDMATNQAIADKFTSEKKDMIFAISTPSAQAAYNSTKEIPILITAVTDPVSCGLASSLKNTGNNILGTSDSLPIEKNLELIKLFVPNVKNIGVLYNTSEANSQIQVNELKEYAKKNKINIIEKAITTSNDVSDAMSSLDKKIDALYIPTDNLIVSCMPIVSKIAISKKIPVIASEEGSLKSGALASCGIDYSKLGYKTGQMAVKILKGEKVSNFSIETLNETKIVVNEKTLKSLSIKKPNSKNINYLN